MRFGYCINWGSHFWSNSHVLSLLFCFQIVGFMSHVVRHRCTILSASVACIETTLLRHDESDGIKILGEYFFLHISFLLRNWGHFKIRRLSHNQQPQPFSSSGWQTLELCGYLVLWCRLQLQLIKCSRKCLTLSENLWFCSEKQRCNFMLSKDQR